MSAAAFKLRALQDARPLNVHLELTYACNWRCVFCYNPRHFDRTRMSAAEWAPVLDDLRALGTLTLTLTGGEPLAHPEFFVIAAEARQRGFALRIFTNATLVDDATAQRIAALHPVAVEVSVHGATAEIHDAATARPGSFEASVAGVRRLVAHRVPVVLKTPVTRLNEEHLDAIVALAAELDLTLQLDPHLTPRDDGDAGPLRFGASVSGIRRAFELGRASGVLEPMERSRGGVNCGVGRITMAIDPEGNVYPCMQWRHRSLGNVRDTALRTFWHDSAVRLEAAATSVAVNDHLLDAGATLASFPFCPALAIQETGDPLVPDESFELRAAVAAAMR